MTLTVNKDFFILYPSHIEVRSKSGNTYYITLNNEQTPICTCKGFGYYNKCRHIDEAREVHNNFFVVHTPEPEPELNPTMLNNLAIVTGRAKPLIPRRRIHDVC
jgi:uncharacterized protein (DUF2461 family)